MILDHAAKWDYIVVTTDRAMRKAPHFQALIRVKQLRVVFIKTGSARQLDAWGIAKLVIKAWDGIEQHASTHGRPFLALVQRNGRVMRA